MCHLSPVQTSPPNFRTFIKVLKFGGDVWAGWKTPQQLDQWMDGDVTSFSWPGRVAQSVGHLTRKSGVLGSIPGLAIYFRFSFRFFKKGSCQLLAKVCARSTG